MASAIAVPKGNETTMSTNKEKQQKLLHPVLLQIPMEIRFGIQGLLSNGLFMVSYNTAIEQFHQSFEAASIYAVVYFFFIPVGHLISCLVVFGWPENYVQNLLSNFPIGISAIALGSACTAYLDSVDFNSKAESFVDGVAGNSSEHEEGGEFYSSLVVMVITGVYSYLASCYVNGPSKSTTVSEKKEL